MLPNGIFSETNDDGDIAIWTFPLICFPYFKGGTIGVFDEGHPILLWTHIDVASHANRAMPVAHNYLHSLLLVAPGSGGAGAGFVPPHVSPAGAGEEVIT